MSLASCRHTALLNHPVRAQAMDALGDAHTLRRACYVYVPAVSAALQELAAVEFPDAGVTGELSQASADSAGSAGSPRGAGDGGESTAVSGLDMPKVPTS